MKKWMYIIFPGAMLALFLVAYLAETRKLEEREVQHKQTVAKQAEEKAAKEAVLRQKAEADAKKRSDDRAAENKKKEDERMAKWMKDGQDIQDATNKANAEADKSAKQIAQMETELQNLRTAREKANREYLELVKNVERARIDRRTAELEIQRTTEMIAKRAGDSFLTRPPAPAPQKAS